MAHDAMPDEPRQSVSEPPAAAGRPRVVLVRDPSCLKPNAALDAAAVRRMLDEAVTRVTGKAKPLDAWKGLFAPRDRVAVKVNTLGHPTHPVVASSIVDRLLAAGLPAGRLVIWDRSVAELRAAGYKIQTDPHEVRCLGTDAFGGPDLRTGYEPEVAVSGAIGSRFSTIVSRFATALINVPVLKDHSIAGLSGGLKNFFGAIHNPNKYHDNLCDPYVADVSAHPWIRNKLRLVVVDATYAQYHGGPGKVPRCLWPMGALLVGLDPVAVDSVSWYLLDEQRRAKGLKDLAADGRPPKHVLSAEKRGLGVAERGRIEVLEVQLAPKAGTS